MGSGMPGLSDLSDKTAVDAAIKEFHELGRERFLAKHGFGPGRDYFLLDGDLLIDSKALAAVAYSIQYPDRPRLTTKTSSGGVDHAVRALRKLDFNVETRAIFFPPRLGDEYPDRTAVYERYGGDKVPGIMCFPGDPTVNVFSDAEGPYTDDPPTLTEAFGYRGQGLNGDQRVDFGGNARLEGARLSRAAVRFWYKPSRGQFAFLTWAVVVGRSWVLGRGADGVQRSELDWQLEPVPGPLQSEWPTVVTETLEDTDVAGDDNPRVPEASPTASYGDLVSRVESRGQGRKRSGVVRVDYARSQAARRAVLVRSEGKCESIHCTGMPPEPNRQGEAILDVDHVLDLAKGGEDHPRNMVALCPNCHAVKTRGANIQRWRKELAKIALQAHAKLVADEERRRIGVQSL
jgi:5-methylcytosine-specific restriction protein A